MQGTILTSGKAKLNRNTNLRNSANAVCEASVRSHLQQTDARRDELELLAAITAKVHERYG